MAGITTMVVATGLTVGSQYRAQEEQKKARKEQKRQSNIERRKAAVQNARNRRREQARARIASSQQEAAQAASQASSTGFDQSIGAIQSQSAGSISFQRGMESLGQNQIASGMRQNRYLGNASRFQAYGNLSGQLGINPLSFIQNMGMGGLGGGGGTPGGGGAPLTNQAGWLDSNMARSSSTIA